MTNRSRRDFLIKTTGAAGAAALGTLGFPAIVRAEAKEWVIGASMPLTGPFATAGQLGMPGIIDFIAMTNDSGGIGGKKIRGILEDSGYVPSRALANFKKALAEAPDLACYFGDSTGFMKLVAPELNSRYKIMTGSTSFASELANPSTNPYQYVSGPTYQDMFGILLQHVADKGGKRLAFVYSDTEFGKDPIAYGRQRAKELGIELVHEEITKASGAEVQSHVAQLRRADPDFIVMHGYVTGVWPAIIATARAFGMKSQFLGTFWAMEKVIADKISAKVGDALNGYMGVIPYRYFYDRKEAPAYQELDAWNKANNEKYPGYLVTWYLQVRMTMNLWKKAMEITIEADKPVNGDNLMTSLASIKDWDSGGFFGNPVSIVSNKIPQGRVYAYNTENKLFLPKSDWIQV